MAEDDVDSDISDIADALIVTNLGDQVFDDVSVKEQFEAAFKGYDAGVTFNYLKSFHRARVNFTSTEATVQARLALNETELCGQQIKCYFAQVPKLSSDEHLHPPKPEKMFLISPPCSPPVGWEQMPESEPVLNFELIAALSRLTPGEAHELHPPSASQPSIVVHVCEDPEGYTQHPIVQTRCPEHK
ncbi:hypothetical protein BaRGS_00013943 [Batillaria attramentaria]|uniref:Uncharacterized protein n=1 Tax=Batillaria attramentaria TaxID=370345 RepID=A0ABD0L5J2_9CAEN